MKTQLIKTMMIAALTVGFAAKAEVSAAGANPYAQGTGIQTLSAEKRASLLQYAENSKAYIVAARAEVRGLSASDAKDVYIRAIIRIVKESFDSEVKQKSELLLRQALNQALEMTVGTPDADGTLNPDGGLLKDSMNQELVNEILVDSLNLAEKYYPYDHAYIAATDAAKAADLPVNTFAYERLQLAHKWNARIMEMSVSYQFLDMSIQHWFNTVTTENNLHMAALAVPITQAEDVLNEVKSHKADGDQLIMMRQVRGLRAAMSTLLANAH